MREKTESIYAKSCALIPAGVNSPARSFKGLGLTPMVVESGSGALIYDVDGNCYIDYCMAWGSQMLGHAHPQIVGAVIDQLHKGSSFGIATEVELLLAEKIVSHVPSVEKIRFVSSGTEATMTALRLARGFTKREKIAKFIGHYHGHHDSLLVKAGSGASSLAASSGVNQGVIDDTLCLPFNDMEALDSLRSDLAAVIVEPIAGNMGVVLPKPLFLEKLRKVTKENGSLLIFDEVITGFRVSLGGAQGIYGIDPDLSCFGKIIGGGFPAAAVGGRKEILDHLAPLGSVYQAGTLSGNPIAMRAGLALFSFLEEEGFYENLRKKTDRLTSGIQRVIQAHGGYISQMGSMFSPFFAKEMFPQFFRYLFERGIYIPPSCEEAWFISSAHTEEMLDYTQDVISSFFHSLR